MKPLKEFAIKKPRIAGYFIGALLAVVIVGCASPNLNSTVFQSESLVADTATGATHFINVYVASQTNPPASLLASQQQVWKADEQISLGLQVTEALRVEYAANPNTTNAAALGIALSVVQAEQTNIVNLVNSLTTTNTP